MLAGTLTLAACTGAGVGSAGRGQEGALEATEMLPVLTEEELTSVPTFVQTHRSVQVGSVFMLEREQPTGFHLRKQAGFAPEPRDGCPAARSCGKLAARVLPGLHPALMHGYFVLKPAPCF